MAKLTLSDLVNLENQTTAVAAINANNALIENALEITLSRDGTTPNIMVADLDMNSNSILNLPDPTVNTEPVTLGYGTAHYGDSLANSTAAAASASAAATSASGASTSASAAATSASAASTSATAAATSATSAASTLAAVAYKYTWSTNTASSDPTAGILKVNNAAPGSATALYISETDANGNSLATEIARWDDAINSAGRARIKIAKDATNFLLLSIASAVTDNGAWDTFTVSGASLAGSLSNGDTVYLAATTSGSDGSGDVSSNTATSVDSEIVLFSSTTGKVLKRATTTGILKGTSGVISAATSSTDYAPATSGSAILKGNGSGGFSAAAAGTDYCGITSGSSVLKGSSGNTTAATAGTDYVKPDTTSALTAGFTSASVSAGTKTSGTYTFDPTVGGVQHYTNGGAHTLAPPATHGSWQLDMVNNGSAGVVTVSGFTRFIGDAFDTTNTHSWRLTISNGNQGSVCTSVRMV